MYIYMFIFVANRTSSQITAPSIYICTHISLCCKSNFFTDNGAKFIHIYMCLFVANRISCRYRRQELICLRLSFVANRTSVQMSAPSLSKSLQFFFVASRKVLEISAPRTHMPEFVFVANRTFADIVAKLYYTT